MMNAALNSNEMYGGSHIVNQNQKESSNVDGPSNKRKKGFFARINLTLIVGVLVMVVFLLLLLLIVLICLYNELNQSNQSKTTPVRYFFMTPFSYVISNPYLFIENRVE